ncbi:hypothetical protein HJFPF1_11437 [Paramyrothecium foliicola]|nr:hypothetical protein HJFPF1_11437 [Paramyrothecium foliicola]
MREERRGSINPSRSIPARLLRVGFHGEVNVALQDISPNADTDDHHNYAALSYCWGPNNDNVQTFQRNIDEMRKGIPLASLPVTIQHAIEVTRGLELPYLWVDALCIIQDGREDKKQEISKMAAIFGCAMVVISAAVAESCDQGFLQPRIVSDLLGPVYKFPYYPDSSEPQDGFIVTCRGHLCDGIQSHPIDKRAWTLEEHTQAISLLQFGKRQVRWTCEENNNPKLDGGHGDLPNQDTPYHFVGKYNDLESGIDDLNLWSVFTGFCSDWMVLVEQYTGRSLTHQRDSLPAFGIIAENFAKTTKGKVGEYCAGMWEKDLSRQLLWFKTNPVEETETETLKPTWSWASLPGSVQFWCTRFTEPFSNVKVIGCNMNRHNSEWDYGSVISGVITIEARLRPLFWKGTNESVSEEFASIVAFVADCDSSSIVEHWDMDRQEPLNKLFCLELLPAKNTDKMTRGLILCHIDHDQFERRGYYECWEYLVKFFDRQSLEGECTDRTRRITIV